MPALQVPRPSAPRDDMRYTYPTSQLHRVVRRVLYNFSQRDHCGRPKNGTQVFCHMQQHSATAKATLPQRRKPRAQAFPAKRGARHTRSDACLDNIQVMQLRRMPAHLEMLSFSMTVVPNRGHLPSDATH